jgi:hypothetical protein
MRLLKPFFLLIFLNNFSAFTQVEASYGNNKEIGKFIKVNDIKMYYEIYGEGKPLLLIHGNKTGIKG